MIYVGKIDKFEEAMKYRGPKRVTNIRYKEASFTVHEFSKCCIFIWNNGNPDSGVAYK